MLFCIFASVKRMNNNKNNKAMKTQTMKFKDILPSLEQGDYFCFDHSDTIYEFVDIDNRRGKVLCNVVTKDGTYCYCTSFTLDEISDNFACKISL